MKAKALKIISISLATIVMAAALIYYNFIDKPVPSVEPGSMCPQFTVSTYDRQDGQFVQGEDVSIYDLKGKVVILNFWSTTCGSCMEEMPHFDEFQKAYKDDVVILALDGEVGQSYDKILNWMNKFRTTQAMEDRGNVIEKYQWDTFDITFGYYDPNDNDVGELLGFSGSWPSTAIIDKKGFIQYKHQGVMSYEDLEAKVKPML